MQIKTHKSLYIHLIYSYLIDIFTDIFNLKIAYFNA